MNEVLVFRHNEFVAKITNVPDFILMEQVLDAYANYCDVERRGLVGIWLYPGSSVNFNEFGIQ